MKLQVWSLGFLLDFHDATHAYAERIGEEELEKAGLEPIEDTIEFNEIIGEDWRHPEMVIITIDGIPWMIPCAELEDEEREDHPATDLNDLNWNPTFRYIGADEKLLRAVMKIDAKLGTL